MESILRQAFKEQGSIRLFDVSTGTPAYRTTVECTREPIESDTFGTIVGVGMTTICIYNVALQEPAYWSETSQRFTTDKSQVTYYPNITGSPDLTMTGTTGSAVA